MTLNDILDNLNEIYNGIDDNTQVPNEDRINISTKIEDLIDLVAYTLDEYGDEPEDDINDEEDFED